MTRTFGISRNNFLAGLLALGVSNAASPMTHRMTQAVIAAESRSVTVVEGYDIAFNRVENTQEFSQSRVGQIAQDASGFMWFGTQYGLYRFDGYSHAVFADDPRVKNQLSGVFIYAVQSDPSGKIWISTDQGVNIFDPKSGTFSRINYAGAANPTVQSFYRDRSGVMWLSTSAGLYGLDTNGQSIFHFRHDRADSSSLASDDLKFAKEDRSGVFWVASSSGLEAIDRHSGTVITRVPLREPRELNFVEDRAGLLWIYHAGGAGLSSYDRSTNTLTRYRFVDADGNPLPRFGIFTALADRDGRLWFGTGGAGLLRLDSENGRFVRYRHSATDPQSLSGDDIVALFQDREDNVWVALHGEQLNLFPARKSPFAKLPPRPFAANVRVEKMVNSVMEVNGKSLWISYMGMLLGVNQETGQRQNLHERLGLQADVISMARDGRGRVWLGTSGTGLVVADASGGVIRFQHDASDSNSLAHDVVDDILVDHSGNLWFATWGGLSRFDPESGGFANYKPSGMDPKYLALAEDREGRIWLGTHEYGLQRFDPVTKEFVTYPPSAAPGGVSNGRVNAVRVDRRGVVWAGTQNGLDALDPATGKMHSYGTRNGLPGNAISCILEDAHRRMWVGTNNGLARLDADTGKVQGFSRIDGLPGLDFTGWGACYQSPSRRMYFAGFSGATAFYPDHVRMQRRIPPVEFTDLVVAGRESPDGVPGLKPRLLPVPARLSLPYSQNSFTTGFAALSYNNPTAIAYRFRLAGLEKEWHVVDSSRRVAAYNSLPVGNYRLEVQAAANGGSWSETKTLELVIQKPWWQTTLFRAFAALLILAMVFVMYQWRVRHVMHRFQLRLDERVTERTRIARELHDSLLQGFHGLMFRLQAVRNLLPKQPEDAAVALDEALVRGDETVGRAREAVTGLRTSGANDPDLEGALRSLARDISMCSPKDPPECDIDIGGKPRQMIPLVRDEVLQVAREAVRNAMQHSKGKVVRVEIDWGSDRFSIRVRDDGIGLDSQLIAQGLEGHWGIHGMRERTKQVGGNLEIRSDGTGTLVELTISASRAYVRSD